MKTTLNIRIDILEQIAKAADFNKISCSGMIILLIQKVMADISDPGRLGRMVQYQGRARRDEWHVFHIILREDMYEYWLDARKLLKMSVSLILAYAVKRFLGKGVKSNISDNYLFRNYIIMKEVIDSVIIWKFIWGCPPHIEQLINYEHSD